MELLELH